MSGFEYPLRDLVRDWQGQLVHPSFADRRNPQDFVRGVREHSLPYTSPEAPDSFVNQILSGIDVLQILRALDGNPLTSREVHL